jgi:hypothetical protein
MFEYLGTILVDIDPGFDVLRYLTVRTFGRYSNWIINIYFIRPNNNKVSQVYAV